MGGRPVNEDSFVCGENYFVVSDGLGGHDNGEIASGAAVNYIAENFRSDISNKAIARLLTGADEAVRQSGKGGKATVAALFTDGNKIQIANIGDSRVYYFRGGRNIFRTKDHSVCQASVDMGEMTDDDVRNSADRSGLFKVLGDSEPLKLPKSYDALDPCDGDAFLICSDGFWEHLYDMEIAADLLKSANARDWLTHMLKRLLLRSENAGDNFTAICGMIHAPEKFSEILPLSDRVHADIPPTNEMTGENTVHGRKNLVLILSAVIAAAAIVVIAAALLHGDGDPDGGTEEDLSTEQYSTFESTRGFPTMTETTDIPENAETTDMTESPDTTDITEIGGITEETVITDNSEIPAVPEETYTTEDSDVPELPDIIEAAGTAGVTETSETDGTSEPTA